MNALKHTPAKGLPPRTKALQTIMAKRELSFAKRLEMASRLVAVVSSNWSIQNKGSIRT